MPETDTIVETLPTSGIALNDDVALDLATLIATRLLIQESGEGGKSLAIRRLLKQSHGSVQHLLLVSVMHPSTTGKCDDRLGRKLDE